MFALLFLVGCSEFGLDSIDDDRLPARLVAIEDSFAQTPLPAVDLLFVVDNTASMAVEQDALADDFSALADTLADAGVAWQIGVVTTDLSDDEAGLLLGMPWVLTPDVDDPEAAFADVIRVGTAGTPPEAGLAAATMALELAVEGGPNAGFRRPDAALHVIFVSDADDESGPGARKAFLDALEADAEATGLSARASAVVGDVPGGCVSSRGAAQAGERYHEVVDETGGITTSICAGNFSPLLTSLGEASLTYQTEFPLRTDPLPGSIRVQVAGTRVTEGWKFIESPPTVVFDEAPAPAASILITYFVEVPP